MIKYHGQSFQKAYNGDERSLHHGKDTYGVYCVLTKRKTKLKVN